MDNAYNYFYYECFLLKYILNVINNSKNHKSQGKTTSSILKSFNVLVRLKGEICKCRL
jgi:hypothetical protein